ncbi:MAG: hypothetical protein K1X66_04115 [Verrucomicrobiae bacterium]|nr:hypothetical protein [Verrucomicrobiae bacterium]
MRGYRLGLFLVGLGLFILVIGFLFFDPFIPPQDAPLELQRQFDQEKAQAIRIYQWGKITLLLGGIGLLGAWLRTRLRGRCKKTNL